jgi:peptide/nickel transport system permease protein
LGRYVIRRLLWVVLVMLIVTLLTFSIFYIMPPGDPALRFAGRQPTPELLAEVRKQLGLDKPLFGIEFPKVWESRPWDSQYFIFLDRLVTGDQYGWPGLGFSYNTRNPIKQEIADRAPRTLWLAAGAAVIWLMIGISIGIVSALKRRTIYDRAAMSFALFGISAPVFWLGLMALFIFWQLLDIQAVGSGYVPLGESVSGFLSHLIMPWVVLSLLFAAFYARMTRGNLIDTMGEDYIRTARAKGLRERDVVVKHGLRASLTPVVTIFGMDLALLVGGAVITETVFNLQGLGAWAVTSVVSSDIPAVMGVVLVASIVVAVMNLVVDILYAYLDPRVRYT